MASPRHSEAPETPGLDEEQRRHRRRRVTGKRFQCTYEHCGKVYSRAEHLERHKLNHSAKEHFFCDVPGCTLTFVRKDLYIRHTSRHREQAQGQTGEDEAGSNPRPRSSLVSNYGDDSTLLETSGGEGEDAYRQDGTSGEGNESRSFNSGPSDRPRHSEKKPALAKNNNIHRTYNNRTWARQQNPTRSQTLGDVNGSGLSPQGSTSAPDPRRTSSSIDGYDASGQLRVAGAVPSGYAGLYRSGESQMLGQNLLADRQQGPENASNWLEDQAFHLSSPSSTDDFTAWLFDSQQNINVDSYFSGWVPDNAGYQPIPQVQPPSMIGNSIADLLSPSLPNLMPPAGHPMLRGSSLLSIYKRQSLLNLMTQRFVERAQEVTGLDQPLFDELFGVDSTLDQHPLSLGSMQSYLDAYWRYFHPQFPILHPPTFVPDTTHEYLLLAVLIIGMISASRQEYTLPGSREKASKLANFIAYNLRWHVMMHPDASPPGRLWVIQTLLLVEVYEKIGATRALHERAHIYFPMTLTLMRRGSALFARPLAVAESSQAPSPLGSPRPRHSVPGHPIGASPVIEAAPDPSGPSNSLQPTSPETWWDRWIAQEATRRAGFAAFILDATHSTMFGHSPTLVIHEIDMQLPCDDVLWSSRSPSEIGCVESSLYAHGIRPTSFLGGLKKLLSGQPVHTNAYGRIALAAGLLSVSGQMRQRDMYGTTGFLGFREKWQPKLIKALDWWMQDWDESIAHSRDAAFDWQRSPSGSDASGGVFRDIGRTMYHLGHMTIHISMPELCVFAGATRILGRIVSDGEKAKVGDKIVRWANSPHAASVVLHALETVKMMIRLGGDGESGEPRGAPSPGRQFSIISYDALPNRAWILYLATLVLWAYGFALDGPLQQYPSHLRYPPAPADPAANLSATSPAMPAANQDTAMRDAGEDEDARQAQRKDAISYLQRMMPPSVTSSKALHAHLQSSDQRGGRNQVIGLLSIVDEALSSSTWELLEEARQRLRRAALLSRDGEQD